MTVFAQTFPAKPVRIVTSDAGGGSDIVARAMVPALSSSLGQPVIVDNRAGGVIAGDFVAKAPPDGHTLIYYGNTLWLLPLMSDKVPYDTVRDFVPISMAVTAPNILVVHPSLPVKSVKDLIALAKARPGELNYAATGLGSATHLFAELFKAMANVNIVRVNYKGSSQAVTALTSGEVQITIATAGGVAPQVGSGRLRALAVTSLKPSALVPNLPTVAESGLPGYEALLPLSIAAPARTPPAIIRRLNQEIVRVLTRNDAKQKLAGFGVDVIASSPEELGTAIHTDMAKWGKLIKEADIRVE
jgi:tripartite-type tricarboxylate transporter receptor subunit TctC